MLFCGWFRAVMQPRRKETSSTPQPHRGGRWL